MPTTDTTRAALVALRDRIAKENIYDEETGHGEGSGAPYQAGKVEGVNAALVAYDEAVAARPRARSLLRKK